MPHTVDDLSGNDLSADFASQFTTGAGFDTTHASVVNQRPANGATGVSVNASPVTLYWNKALNAATVAGAVHVSQNGTLVTGTVTVADGGQTVEFAPGGVAERGAGAGVRGRDGGGHGRQRGERLSGSFTTAANPATTAPACERPLASGAKVPTNRDRAGYSEPL